MLRNRVTYLILLIGVGVFFLCFNGYLSLYALRVALALPVASLLISLPGMLTLRARITAAAPRAQKGQPVTLRLAFSQGLPMASPRGRAILTVENTLTGQRQEERLSFSAARRPTVLTYRLASPACGQVVVSLAQARVCDYMGLFALPLRTPEASRRASVLFYPAARQPDLRVDPAPQAAGEEGERYSQTRPGDDPAEIFAFREYREGDRLSRVHWKLSQRVGELQVKELGLPVNDQICFLLEPMGGGEGTDTLLDAFATLSGFLTGREIPHRVGFAPQGGEELSMLEVAAPEDAQPALDAVLLAGARDEPLPLPRPGQLPAGATHILYLCQFPQERMLSALAAQAPQARVTALWAGGPDSPRPALPPGVQGIALDSDGLEEELGGLQL